jgi:hypothetical protein
MRELSKVLLDLIDLANDVVTRKGMTLGVGMGAGEQFSRLAAEVREAEQRPADGVRATYGAVIMINALEAFCATGGAAGSPWLMLAGAALPLLRADAWLALNQEKAAQQETKR